MGAVNQRVHSAPLQPSGLRGLSAAGVAQWSAPAAVAALLVALGATHVWWLLRFRRGFPVDIDEAGYLWFSFVLHDRLREDGPLGLAKAVQHQGFFPPLLPSVT